MDAEIYICYLFRPCLTSLSFTLPITFLQFLNPTSYCIHHVSHDFIQLSHLHMPIHLNTYPDSTNSNTIMAPLSRDERVVEGSEAALRGNVQGSHEPSRKKLRRGLTNVFRSPLSSPLSPAVQRIRMERLWVCRVPSSSPIPASRVNLSSTCWQPFHL